VIKSATCAAMALGLLSAPVMAGEFFTGTRSNSSRFENNRISTGTESVKATRNYKSKIKGHSNKQFLSRSFSADGLRLGNRGFTFTEVDRSANAELQTTGNGDFDITAGGGGGPSGGGGSGQLDNVGRIAAAGSLGSEFASIRGQGNEQFKDGSYNFSSENGAVNVTYKQSEDGRSVYTMDGNFSAVETESGSKSSGGSVFSLN